MHVADLLEFSDHCPISFCINYTHTLNNVNTNNVMNSSKVVWDHSKRDLLLTNVLEKQNVFDAIVSSLYSESFDIDKCIDEFTNIVHDISLSIFGKQFIYQPKKNQLRSSPWFNDDCRKAKSLFLNAKRALAKNGSDDNKLSFLNKKKQYNFIKRNSKYNFILSEKKRLSKLSKSAPRKFWKHVNSMRKKPNVNTNIETQDFANHFANISNKLSLNIDFSNINNNVHVDIQNVDCLDCPFKNEEINNTIKSLKRNKSCDLDGNVADFFIDTVDFISPYLCTIFNKIISSGVYPKSWSKGVIVPVFKKGDNTGPANYRCITLINTMSKIFSLCLRTRLNKWCEENSIFNESQFGFRDKKSTSDAIFLLHCFIQKILANNSKLYTVFIDYGRAFDTVIRDALWFKLINEGTSSKMLTILKSMYLDVKACVRLSHDTRISDFFDVSLGLKKVNLYPPYSLYYL